MADKLHLKVLLTPATCNLDELWRNVCFYAGTHLGGESSYYVVEYDGPQAEGLEVLNYCLAACETGKFYADFGP